MDNKWRIHRCRKPGWNISKNGSWIMGKTECLFLGLQNPRKTGDTNGGLPVDPGGTIRRMLSYASSDGEKNQSKGTRQEHNIAIQRHVREATQLWEETLLDLCVSSLRGAMLIFSVSFQFYRMIPEGTPLDDKGDVVWGCDMTLRTLPAASKLHQNNEITKPKHQTNRTILYVARTPKVQDAQDAV